METNQDWSALAADWQRQDTPAIDVEAIRDEAERRGRSLRRTVWVEVGFSVLVILVCVLIALSPRSDRVETLLFAAMAVFLVGYQALMLWIRRRDLADAGRDAASLVDREMQRARTVLVYWRWGMWSALALWLAIFLMLMYGMQRDWPMARVGGLVGGIGINVLVFPAMGLYGWWRCSQARARLKRFAALRDQLRAP
ncbi:MAG TPA: hypothetical protein PLG89_05490 [Arenimonas sp.]|nr:hypothetical protein [Arenimonas sp.]